MDNNTNKPLFEKYRPARFEDVIGQEQAVKRIGISVRNGFGGKAFWLAGKSGTGKTTLAKIMARQHGGMVFEFDSANQFNQAQFDQLSNDCRLSSWCNQTYIINEAHGLKSAIVRQMLGLLERMPAWLLIVFTTTLDGDELFEDHQFDAGPFASRVISITLTSQGLADKFARLVHDIAQAEGLNGKEMTAYKRLANDTRCNCRAMLQAVETGAMSE